MATPGGRTAIDTPTPKHSMTLDANVRDFDTVFIVGAGIEDRAWDPVFAALSEVASALDIGEDAEAANFFFARHVYTQRWALSPSPSAVGLPPSEFVAERIEYDRLLKTAIATHLERAVTARELPLRQSFLDLFDDPKWGRKVVLSTNWDLAFEQQLNWPAEKILHIHGSVAEPGLLFLPSEVANEPYRSREDAERMFHDRRAIVKHLSRARHVVIAGCSISPLDAELGMTIGEGLNHHRSQPCRVTIFNTAKEMGRVERRARLVTLPGGKVTFEQVAADKSARKAG